MGTTQAPPAAPAADEKQQEDISELSQAAQELGFRLLLGGAQKAYVEALKSAALKYQKEKLEEQLAMVKAGKNVATMMTQCEETPVVRAIMDHEIEVLHLPVGLTATISVQVKPDASMTFAIRMSRLPMPILEIMGIREVCAKVPQEVLENLLTAHVSVERLKPDNNVNNIPDLSVPLTAYLIAPYDSKEDIDQDALIERTMLGAGFTGYIEHDENGNPLSEKEAREEAYRRAKVLQDLLTNAKA